MLRFTIFVGLAPIFLGNSPYLPPTFAKNAPYFALHLSVLAPYKNVDSMGMFSKKVDLVNIRNVTPL